MLLSDRFTRPPDDVTRKKGNAGDSKTRAPVTLFQNPGELRWPRAPVDGLGRNALSFYFYIFFGPSLATGE